MTPSLRAYTFPFIAFMLFLGLSDLVKWIATKTGATAFWLTDPQYWVYPLQTLVCAGLILFFWRKYRFQWTGLGARGWSLSLAFGVLAIVIWVAPQEWLGAEPRLEGFDPGVMEGDPLLYWGTWALRFLRLVVIVPILEEVFWRGFLMRYLIDENFENVRYSQVTWQAFGIVALVFGLAHWGPDFTAAVITGALYNLLAILTRSIPLCIIAHALTNLLLGLYIVRTGQWGFW